MKKKINLLLIMFFALAIFAQQDTLNVFLSEELENYFLFHTSNTFKKQNLSDILSRREYLEYKLNHSPYLKNITFIHNILDYVPIELIDKYYVQDIELMSLYNFIDLKVNLQNPDYIMFSLPLDKWDITWKNFLNPKTYYKSWFKD
ncbi:MAG: hypothetical protein SVM86_01930 [Candidatus Cloacimonadota bacterium]|nr:hypothetical protein [Candidatus Cloacimonadota bacterium]